MRGPLSRVFGDRLGRRRVSLLTAAATLFGTLLVAGAVGPASAARDLTYFTDATRTVACEISTADEYTLYDSVRCDLLGSEPPLPLPPRQPGCPTDWGAVVTMDQNEVQFPRWGACVGDSIAGGSALEAGEEVRAGVFRCVVLTEGVRCQNRDTRYGFVLSRKVYKTLRPAAKPKLSSSGIGKLRLGMTVARAKKARLTGDVVCDSPQLAPRLHMKAWLGWHNGRFFSVLANSYTNVQTTKGVGVGSTLAQVRGKYRGHVVATKDLVDGGARAYVYVVRGKRGKLVFLLQTPYGTSPSATTPVDALWVTRRWNPKKGYAFDGC